MPIIDNSAIPLSEPKDGRSTRRIVTKDSGAVNLTLGELVMQDGSSLRLHTHPTDEAIFLLEGQVEMVVGDEHRLVTAGHILFAPPGTPHRLINNTGAPARMYTIFPTDDLRPSMWTDRPLSAFNRKSPDFPGLFREVGRMTGRMILDQHEVPRLLAIPAHPPRKRP